MRAHTRTSLAKGSITALYPLATLAVLVAVWKAVQVGFETPPYLLPAPERVLQVVVRERALLFENMMFTLREVVYGFVLASVVGVSLAAAMASWRAVERSLYLPLAASQGIPKTALAPLLSVWLGFGIQPKVVMAVLIAFFPIVVATFVGLRSVSPELVELGKVMHLSRFARLRKIVFPNALPSIFGGLKVGMTLALVGAIVAEFVGAEAGLGYLLIVSSSQVRTDLMMAALVCVAGIGITLFLVLHLLERVAIPWYDERQLHVVA